MDRTYIKNAILEIDFSQIQDLDNPRASFKSNKKFLEDLQIKYPDMIRSNKELLYWAIHYKDPDFIDSQFCQCGNRKNFFVDHFCYREYCSSRCARIFNEDKIRQTNLERYGVEHALKLDKFKQKQKQTNLERYGAATPMEVQEFKEKAKQTNLERYGVEYVGQAQRSKIEKTFEAKYSANSPMKSKEIQDKVKQTNLERYGVEQYLKSEKAKEKIKQTNLKKYHRENPAQIHVHHLEDQTKEFIEKHFIENNRLDKDRVCAYFNIKDTAFERLIEKLKITCPLKSRRGVTQKEIYDFVVSCSTDALNDCRTIIYPKELDIYIPSKKIAIEYDGLMYHSFGKSDQKVFDNWSQENSNNHLIKTQLCEEQNIHLFHIFEDEWIDPVKQEIWKSMILNALGNSKKVYARRTEIKKVPIKEKEKFLEENHLQGTCASGINLGLYHNNELVSLMTFGKSRFNKNYEYELLRFCNKKNTSIVGGASKLLKHFIKEYSPKSIISYANRRWSQGKLYENLGFSKIRETKPNYFYFSEGDKLFNRMSFQKHKLASILPEFNPEFSETENMYNNGYRKIYDCGNLVYELKL